MVSPSSDSTPVAILQFTYHAIRLSILLQVLGLWLHVHLRVTFFLGLGLTVTEQKSTETRLKNIKNVKRCRDSMLKICKQGRDDIIVKANLQSPIPTSFCTTVAN